MTRLPLRPPAPAAALKRLANSLLQELSTLLFFFGLALLVVGAGVQISRHTRLQSAEAERPAPRLSPSMRRVAPAVAGETGESELQAAPPVRIVIDSVQLDSPVVPVGYEARIVNGEFEGNVWQTADFAAGYHDTSALPGLAGNTVISGHNNLRGAVFKDLYLVDLGDVVRLEDARGRTHAYEVVESFVAREESASESERRDNTQWIRQTPDERLTLVSCFPPWSNSHRIIVLAFPTTLDDAAARPAAGRTSAPAPTVEMAP